MFNIETVLADCQPVFLNGLKNVLKKAGKYQIEVKAQFQDGKELMAYLLKSPPRLLILDLNLKTKDGFEVIKWMKSNKLRTKILILTAYDDERFLKMAQNLKVDGYLLKAAEEKDIKGAVYRILEQEGTGTMMQNISAANNGLKATVKKVSLQDGFIKRNNLTKRERQIVGLIADAMSSKEIAKVLYISDQTVSVHRKNIMRKLGVSNAAALVKVAYTYGWK
jgi:two-component system NarL family response regulator